MARKYDSSRRRQAAEETRRDILRAALRLHQQGITEFGPLAEEAGCSVPTVRRHYPTREDLFRDCTRAFAESQVMPDVAALGTIRDPATRLREAVAELCRIHEAMLGYAWLSERERDRSPTLESEMQGYEGLADAIAGVVAGPAGPGVIRGLLDHLTYRALRLSGDLSPDEVRTHLITILRPLLQADDPTTDPPAGQENPES